ncbi:thioesterase family protein [Cytobacillus solani]|uniref:Thioesterase n=1 Tax=Cytobacillus solani TaxID=1637975 RepID=A0A0Q3T763_9BACI|nr:thioesterase [Cytobacillus solani]KOP82347.1 thioesterase [Bacillus sp. FJAT-21945]KQL19357.1 thioesterase [Cytobacillus solani]USK57269.1 thioesterase [Cytobacillus solani]
MKQRLKIGDTATVKVIVTPDMFAQFEGKIVHRVFSTVSMVYHMEWASRKIILPFLEEHEEGMGGAVTVKHLAPSTEGSQLIITATVSALEENTVMTKVSVKQGERLVGTGEVKQVILPKGKIDSLLAKVDGS